MAKPNAEYWQNRAEAVIRNSEKSALEAANDLKRLYAEAAEAVQREIEAFYGRYAKETGLTLSEVKARLAPGEMADALKAVDRYMAEAERLGGLSRDYRAYLRQLSARAYMTRLEELKLHMRNAIERLYKAADAAIAKGLAEAYEYSYMRTMFDAAQGLGLQPEFTALNPRMMATAINRKWLGENYSDRLWAHKADLLNSLDTTFMQGVARGWNPRKIGRAMADDVSAKYDRATVRNCVRLAHSEFMHIANQATADAYKEYGVVKRFMFRAALDERTCKICGELDGQTFDVDEAETGVNQPPAHPRCRCTTIPDIDSDAMRELLKKSERIAREPGTGKAYYVPATMTYKEWRDSLSERDGEAFLSAQKMSKHYAADKEQFKSYKAYISTARKERGDVVNSLFEGFPTRFQDFQHMKYMRPDEWEIYKANRTALGR